MNIIIMKYIHYLLNNMRDTFRFVNYISQYRSCSLTRLQSVEVSFLQPQNLCWNNSISDFIFSSSKIMITLLLFLLPPRILFMKCVKFFTAFRAIPWQISVYATFQLFWGIRLSKKKIIQFLVTACRMILGSVCLYTQIKSHSCFYNGKQQARSIVE